MLFVMGNSSRRQNKPVESTPSTVGSLNSVCHRERVEEDSTPIPEHMKPVRKKHPKTSHRKASARKSAGHRIKSSRKTNHNDIQNHVQSIATNDRRPNITQHPLYQNFVSTPRLNMSFSDYLIRSMRDRNADSKGDGVYVSPNFFRKQKKKPKLEPIIVRIPMMSDFSDSQSRSTEFSEQSKSASLHTSKSKLSTVKENLSLDDLKPSVSSQCDVSVQSEQVNCHCFCCWR